MSLLKEEEVEPEAIGDAEPVARTAIPEMTEQGKLFETDASDFKAARPEWFLCHCDQCQDW